MKRTQLRRPGPKNIHDGGGEAEERERRCVGKNKQRNDECGRKTAWNCGKIIITTGLIGVGAGPRGERIHRGCSMVSGRGR